MFTGIPKRRQITSVYLKYSGQPTSFGMCTHRQGHILDLVITGEGDELVNDVSMSSMLSDHFAINSEVSLERPFSLIYTQLVLDLPKGLDQLADLSDSTLRGLINKHPVPPLE